MSDCGVCLSSGCDFDGNEFERGSVVNKTRVKCCECEQFIPKGIEHEKARWRNDDMRWETAHTCPICAEIAWAFFCDGRLYFCLWESLEQVASELTTACFNKLKTPEAKKELQRRWMDWKGLSKA